MIVSDEPSAAAETNVGGVTSSIVSAGEVSGLFAPSVASVAVTVFDPAVLIVTLKFFVPPTSAAFAGRLAAPSLDEIATVSVDETGSSSRRPR